MTGLDLLLVGSRSPQLVLGSTGNVEGNELDERNGHRHQRICLLLRVVQVGQDDSRMQCSRSDGWMSSLKFPRVQDVCQLGLAIANECVVLLQGVLVVDDATWCSHVAFRANVDDANVGIGFLGCLQKGREQQLREESMADVVGSELYLVTFFGLGISSKE